MRTNDHKLAQRQQIAFVTPAAAVLLAGIIYERLTHGGQDSLHYVAWLIPVLVGATLAGRLASARDLRRLNQLQRGAERLEAGHYETLNLDTHSDDEFADLARAFNHMVEVLAARDATQRKQNHKLAELNRRMETVLDATDDGIALLDRNGVFALVNRRFCEMLGVESDEVVGQQVVDVHERLKGRTVSFDRLLERVAPTGSRGPTKFSGVAEEVIEVISSERRFLQVYTAPVRDDRRTMNGRIIALHDVTRETELDRMKTDFISVVSHELRTPLTSIKGYTDIILNEQAGEINELQREFLSIIQGSTSRLNNLINDILDISRLESGNSDVKSERVDFGKIIEDTLRMIKSVSDEKSIQIVRNLPESIPFVRGDSDKIVQILTNLISNAVKYTPNAGTVTITIDVSGASITTCVADTGIGISPEDQRKLFQKFFRADNSSTREAGGTGLGLVIVKSTVELLGGAVWVDSEPGVGSKFYFTLPVFKSLSIGSSAGLAEVDQLTDTLNREEPTGSGNQILIADDERNAYRSDSQPITRRLIDRGLGLVMVVGPDSPVRAGLHHSLHRMGYGVVTAQDKATVLDRARVHRPDLILLDVLTSKRDKRSVGLDILASLQNDPAAQSLPLLSYALCGSGESSKCTITAISFVDKAIGNSLFADRLKSAFPDGKTINVLGIGLDGNLSHFEENAPEFLDRGLILNAVGSSDDALEVALTSSFDLILIDNCGVTPAISIEQKRSDQALYDLIYTLGSNNATSGVPIALTVQPMTASLSHVHIGGANLTSQTAIFDYLAVHVANITSQQGLGPSGMQMAA